MIRLVRRFTLCIFATLWLLGFIALKVGGPEAAVGAILGMLGILGVRILSSERGDQ